MRHVRIVKGNSDSCCIRLDPGVETATMVIRDKEYALKRRNGKFRLAMEEVELLKGFKQLEGEIRQDDGSTIKATIYNRGL